MNPKTHEMNSSKRTECAALTVPALAVCRAFPVATRRALSSHSYPSGFGLVTDDYNRYGWRHFSTWREAVVFLIELCRPLRNPLNPLEKSSEPASKCGIDTGDIRL